MTNFNKTMDYFRKLYRAHRHISIVEAGEFYWLIEGYTVHKVPKDCMELNPSIFDEFTADFEKILSGAESGVPLKSTGLIRKKNSYDAIIPYVSELEDPFTVWFAQKLLDTFDPGFSLKCGSPLSPSAVQYRGETAGIILPVRCQDIDIRPFL